MSEDTDAILLEESERFVNRASRRQKPTKKASRAAAMSRFRLAKEGQASLQDEDDEEDSIFSTVSDEQYKDMVNERKEKSNKFLVDDGTSGYEDDGEEFFEHDENEKPSKKGKASTTSSTSDLAKKQKNTAGLFASSSRSVKKPVEDTTTQKISSMFLKAASSSRPSTSSSASLPKRTVIASEDFDDLMADFDADHGELAAVPVTLAPVAKPQESLLSLPREVAARPVTLSKPKKKPVPVFMTDVDEDEIPDEPVSASSSSQEEVAETRAETEVETAEEVPVLKKEPKIVRSLETKRVPIKVTTLPAPLKMSQASSSSSASSSSVQIPLRLEKLATPRLKLQPLQATAPVILGQTVPYFKTEDGVVPFYFVDAVEEKNLPGTIFLVGKLLTVPSGPSTSAQFVNCVLKVENIFRQVFLCPKTAVFDKFQDEEQALEYCWKKFTPVRRELGIKQLFARATERGYCFEHDDITHCDKQMVYSLKYSFSLPEIPRACCDTEDYRLFGTTCSALEHLLIKRRIMGPSWLLLNKTTVSEAPSCWSRLELGLADMNEISVFASNNEEHAKVLQEAHAKGVFGSTSPSVPTNLPVPPLNVLSIHTKAVLNPVKNVNEVLMVSCLVHRSVVQENGTPNWEQGLEGFTILRKINASQPWPQRFEQEIQGGALSLTGSKVYLCESEKHLLSKLMERLNAIDPDVIVGHNFVGYDLDVLLHRMKDQCVQTWSQMGRLKRSKMPKLQVGPGGLRDSTWQERKVMSGRLICDTYLCGKELVRQSSYSLRQLSYNLLKLDPESTWDADEHEQDAGDTENPNSSIAVMEQTLRDRDRLWEMIQRSEKSSYYALGLMFQLQVIPLTRQLTQLSGNIWSRSLNGGRAERIEYLLLHEFHAKKFIVPDKFSSYDLDQSEQAALKQSKKKAAYKGGLVLEPKRGFYDKFILLLDFNSLYPSIIQEYNICFTTVARHPNPNFQKTPIEAKESDELAKDKEPNSEIDTKSKYLPCQPPKDLKFDGMLPRVIKTLVECRNEVKKLLAKETDPGKKQQHDIRQLALKLTANSMYGCLGFSASRFYAMHLAELVTRKGRDALLHSRDLAKQQLGLDVIYGDTDSLMVNTNSENLDDAKAIAQRLKIAINQHYRLLEIELDGIFKSMLLLHKKKYAALTLDESSPGGFKRETKGLDLVRRDWCPLSKEIGLQILDLILWSSSATSPFAPMNVKAVVAASSGDEEVADRIHDYLTSIREKIDDRAISIDKFAITKALSKAPEEYPDANNLPHVQVAFRLIKQGKSVRVGQHIPYIIVKPCSLTASSTSSSSSSSSKPEGETLSPAMRAVHPEELKKIDNGLSLIDYEWYLTQQLHASISRLCSVLPGTDGAKIAECLGLDSSKYKSSSSSSRSSEVDEYNFNADEQEKFRNCQKLNVFCSQCKQSHPFAGVLEKSLVALPSSSTAIEPMDEGDESSLSASSKSKVRCGLVCPNCFSVYDDRMLLNTLQLSIRQCVNRYYNSWMICEEPSCSHRSKSALIKNNKLRCPAMTGNQKCDGFMRVDYTDRDLYTQLLYFRSLFDLKVLSNVQANERRVIEPYRPSFNRLFALCDQHLRANSRNFLDCSSLFSSLAKVTIS